ncbi:cyclase family protein [Halieaceae bacterium IMCC14734]|uniref:Cyclase family protein n=1 Tax=Candidatus Litorirhabdus singularis TaxID=2518993 RepID=A0ABT3TC39_9GAMM|nr:cyclase family protein [Candidatus Litorirhabdus singularis]MCX2979857.1 cyclase family protein [Candidatus Litorirhabdus singularis]
MKPFTRLLLSLALLNTASALYASPAAPISTEQFDQWLQQVSNNGRWGSADELGTLNLIQPAQRKAAAVLVRDGISISLSLPLNKHGDAVNTLPFEHKLKVELFGSQVVASDRYSIEYHGAAHSHMDGLPHVLSKGKMYNGFPASDLQPSGALHLGIENAHAGIVSRGVLVDMAWFKGVDYLSAGTAITISDLEAWERRTRITLGSGDVLLLRTGRWEQVRQSGSAITLASAPGLHASVATWLHARGVAVLGSDVVADVMPSGMADRAIPLHELALAAMGMPLLDNLDLDAAADYARQQGRWTFMFVGAPLRIPGGTGSPLNPLAIF